MSAPEAPPSGARPDPGAESRPSARARRLRVVTRCGTLDDFLSAFSHLVDEASLFVVTRAPRPVGVRGPFVIELGDGSPMMSGEAEVIEALGAHDGVHRGMRLRLLSMDDPSRRVHDQLVARARARHEAGPSLPPLQSAAPPPPVGHTEAPASDLVSAASEPIAVGPPSGERPAATSQPLSSRPLGGSGAGPGARDTPHASRSDTAAPSVSRREEARAPGSAIVLPANPLEDLTDDALAAFVECTLYEERASGILEAIAPPDDVEPAAEGTPGGLIRFGSPPVIPRVSPLEGLPPPAAAQAAAFVHPPAAASAAEGAHSAGGGARRPRLSPVLLAALLIAGIVVTASASLSVGYLLWSPQPAPHPVEAAVSAEPAALAGAATLDDGHVDPTPRRAEPTAPLATGSPHALASTAPDLAAQPPRSCTLSIRSDPPGATVLLDGRPLGLAPVVAVPVACGKGTMRLEHPQRVAIERNIELRGDRAASLFEKMARPPVRLRVTTDPPGAKVFVGTKLSGISPAEALVPGFKEIEVLATMAGFSPVRATIAPKPPEDAVHIELGRPAPRP